MNKKHNMWIKYIDFLLLAIEISTKRTKWWISITLNILWLNNFRFIFIQGNAIIVNARESIILNNIFK